MQLSITQFSGEIQFNYYKELFLQLRVGIVEEIYLWDFG